jgi:hypothetical protein
VVVPPTSVAQSAPVAQAINTTVALVNTQGSPAAPAFVAQAGSDSSASKENAKAADTKPDSKKDSAKEEPVKESTPAAKNDLAKKMYCN